MTPPILAWRVDRLPWDLALPFPGKPVVEAGMWLLLIDDRFTSSRPMEWIKRGGIWAFEVPEQTIGKLMSAAEIRIWSLRDHEWPSAPETEGDLILTGDEDWCVEVRSEDADLFNDAGELRNADWLYNQDFAPCDITRQDTVDGRVLFIGAHA